MRFLLVLMGLIIGCNSSAPSSNASAPMEAKKKIDIPVKKLALPYCPECEMSFDRFPVADTLTYDGKLYGFCSEGCKEAFAKRMGI